MRSSSDMDGTESTFEVGVTRIDGEADGEAGGEVEKRGKMAKVTAKTAKRA